MLRQDNGARARNEHKLVIAQPNVYYADSPIGRAVIVTVPAARSSMATNPCANSAESGDNVRKIIIVMLLLYGLINNILRVMGMRVFAANYSGISIIETTFIFVHCEDF